MWYILAEAWALKCTSFYFYHFISVRILWTKFPWTTSCCISFTCISFRAPGFGLDPRALVQPPATHPPTNLPTNPLTPLSTLPYPVIYSLPIIIFFYCCSYCHHQRIKSSGVGDVSNEELFVSETKTIFHCRIVLTKYSITF